jgi:curved DNA-binding protein CbpA
VTQSDNYYTVLGIAPTASLLEIRRAYRELSKLYHPDTTELPAPQAIAQFQRLNEAYSTLSNAERRSLYDIKIGYARQPSTPLAHSPQYSSAYLDPTDRPLSGGEIFALFTLVLTLIACLLLAFIVGMLRRDAFTLP